LRAIASDLETGRKRPAGLERSTDAAGYFWDARRPLTPGTLKPHPLREYADAIASGRLDLMRLSLKAQPGSGMISIQWRERRPDHWAVLRSIGKSVLPDEPADYMRAIQESTRAIRESHLFSEISHLGSSIQIQSDAAWHVEATVQVINVAEIPSVRTAPTLYGPFKKNSSGRDNRGVSGVRLLDSAEGRLRALRIAAYRDGVRAYDDGRSAQGHWNRIAEADPVCRFYQKE